MHDSGLRRLGPYELGRILGAGGMGDVYRGRDLRLDRSVAIKILKTEYSDRFEREARAISSLNHPHICTLYDVGEHDGTPYLVMELVEGKPLTCPMPTPDAIRYALQIADALAAAHRAGVIHRDLKPANVLIGKGGVKLVDFGLAKTQTDVLSAGTEQTNSLALTGQGVLLGTLAYMPPEQLQGLQVDARTDIFAFGLILFEMLTGRRAYQGPSGADLISNILRQPAPSVLPFVPDLPPMIDRVIRKCLEKNPDARWQSMEAVRDALEWAMEAQAVGAPAPAPRRRGWWIGAVAAAVALSVGTGWMAARSSLAPAPAPRILTDIDFPGSVTVNFDTMLALSPDGQSLAFNSRGTLWLRSLRDGSLRVLAGTQDGFLPFWGPDSRTLGFFAEGKLKRMDVPEGAPSVLADAPNPKGGAWSEQGVILFAPTANGPLMRVAAAGGPVEAVTELDHERDEDAHRAPAFLPGGERFLFYGRSRRLALDTIKVAALGDTPTRGRPIAARQFESGGVYFGGTDGGHLLFLRNRDLVAQPFNPLSAELSGEAAIVAPRVRDFEGVGNFSVARAGALVFGTLAPRQNQPTWVGRDGRLLGTIGEVGSYDAIRLSSDGSKLSVSTIADSAGAMNLWIHDLHSRMDWKLPLRGRVGNGPWSPDGERLAIAWRGPDENHPNVYVTDSRGSEAPQPIAKGGVIRWPLDWSRDGRFLLYAEVDPISRFDVWAASMTGDGARFPVVSGPGKDNEARFSPDGDFIAYQTDEGVETRVYVTPFPAQRGRRQVVSEGAGSEPRWRADGRELYYIAIDRSLMAVPLTMKGTDIVAGRPMRLFGGRASNLPVWHFEPSRAGDRFLVLTLNEDSDATPVRMLTGWQAGLE